MAATTHENVAAALLNMEFGCRTYESWAMQRKLEFQFRLSRMPGNRLRAMVSHCKWNGLMTGAKKPGMHAAQVQRISELVNLNPSLQATDPEISYAMFKKRAAMAVRRSDLHKLTSCSKSIVRKYLQAHSHMDVFPNKMQPYLDGTMSAGMRTTKLLFKAGFAQVHHLHARKHACTRLQSDPSCPFCTCRDETAAHFSLECPQFTEYRTAMREALSEQVGEHAFTEWDALQADEKLTALLNDHRWGKAATGVDYIAKHYLSDIVRERVARLPTTHCYAHIPPALPVRGPMAVPASAPGLYYYYYCVRLLLCTSSHAVLLKIERAPVERCNVCMLVCGLSALRPGP
jgi:hypothetical protein